MTELPEWVWRVVEQTQAYDEEHPTLLRQMPDGSYDSAQCLDGILHSLIPDHVWQAARVMRARRGGVA